MFSNKEIASDKKTYSNLYTKPKFLALKYSPIKKNVDEQSNLNLENLTENKKYNENYNKEYNTENIFAIAKVIGDEFEMPSRGPKMNKKGMIIPYSILGKPDWFKNYLNSKDSEVKIQVTTSSDTAENQKEQKIVRPMTSYVGSQNKTNFSVQRPLTSKPLIEKKEDSHKNIEKTGTILKKEEVLEEINKVKGRIYSPSEKKKRKIPLSAKFFQSKEKNCLNNFDNLEKKWETQSKFYNRKLSRNNTEKPLFEKGECFRQKLELAQLVDNLQTDHEKFGDRYWELTLRKFESQNIEKPKKEIIKIKSIKSRPQTSKKTIENMENENFRPLSAKIETIRNPKRQYDEMPFSSFKSDNYLKKKLEGLDEKITEMKPLIKAHEFDSLCVLMSN